MNKKLIFALAMITVTVWCSSSALAVSFKAEPIPAEGRTAPTPYDILGAGTSCRLQNDNGISGLHLYGHYIGDGYANYFDPVICGIPTYPFGIDTVEFALYNYTTTWPLIVNVRIYEPLNGDSCYGPGNLLYTEQDTIQLSELNVVRRALNTVCCVNGPFFASLELAGPGDFNPITSPIFPIEVDSCRAWAYWSGVWYNWAYVDTTLGHVGYTCIRVIGKTEHPDCMPWSDHKMHFPQLPDLIGWDVNATMPMILADDWQCSQTGWVTGIHFWGSWKDLDSDPTTDDFYTPAPMFLLSIHENIPATQDTPWSRPGRQVWGWAGEIQGVPSEPPTMESWYDPNTGLWNCNDHIPYWQYDFFMNQTYPPADSFFQYKDQIYWLNVSAVNIPEPYKWGWKNSRDHFMDDAVKAENTPGPWYPIIEPPRCNWFDVYFNSSGQAQDYMSTNYYGLGWYRYEYYTNMWFYDNPFTYDHPKHIWLNFNISPVGPQPVALFAINWSTPAWDSLKMGRPPLPGEDEDLYIGRQPFDVILGPNTIDYVLPYNPEWVSVDFFAQDVMINGWIYHECVGTSLDLSFVITGHEGQPPVKCGDVNKDNVIDVGDVVYLINYLFKGGLAPVPVKCVGDVNNDNVVDVGDVVYLINYLFKSGIAPNPQCCTPPWLN